MAWRMPWIGGSIKSVRDNFSDGYQFGDFMKGWMGFYDKQDDSLETLKSDENTAQILGEVQNQARQQYLEDRQHQEMREDTAYQRGVEDMRKAGLNPYTIGANPAPSSSSSVGENSIQSKLSVLGFILNLKNLDLKNRQVANQEINTILRVMK